MSGSSTAPRGGDYAKPELEPASRRSLAFANLTGEGGNDGGTCVAPTKVCFDGPLKVSNTVHASWVGATRSNGAPRPVFASQGVAGDSGL